MNRMLLLRETRGVLALVGVGLGGVEFGLYFFATGDVRVEYVT